MPIHWILSEFAYARHIRPEGISTIADYYRRFGEPRRIRELKRNQETFYHLHGHLPASHLMALPSEPAVYVFDGSGKFLEWCRDPGDIPRYWMDWPDSGETFASDALRGRFAIPK